MEYDRVCRALIEAGTWMETLALDDWNCKEDSLPYLHVNIDM